MKKLVIIFFASAWTAAISQCGSSDDSSGFEAGLGDSSDSSILNDVTFQPVDASGQ